MKKFIVNWKNDLPSSLVVFLVALPLCLGVGLASTNVEGINGVPNVFSGIIAGIVGGIIVGTLSGSRAGVSGPAAGLITIVLAAIVTLGSFEAFLVAVIISGIIQLIAGFAGLGIIGNYFPTSVIKGMLAAIGITLILKEIPHAFGYDADFFGDESFLQPDGHNTFSELLYAMGSLNTGAIIISLVSIAVLLLFETKFMKKISLFNILPAALIVVLLGIGLNGLFQIINPSIAISSQHLVSLPQASTVSDFIGFFSTPDFSSLSNPNVYIIALTIALVGSLETLLSVEATDKLDPEKHSTPTNRELKAQGVGNIVSGLIGGLPITQVIVRSSANINAGAKTKVSAIVHGLLLAITVIFIPNILNLIPLASLAAILIMIGYKLAKLKLFKQLYKQGWDQFLPFCATIIGVLLTDLLKGIGIGIAVAIFYILKKNFQNNFVQMSANSNGKEKVILSLSEEVSFLNKAGLVDTFNKLPEGVELIIDGTKSKSIDFDVLELIHEFKSYGSKEKNIDCEIINIPSLNQTSNSSEESKPMSWKDLKSNEKWSNVIQLSNELEEGIIVSSINNKSIFKIEENTSEVINKMPKTKVFIFRMEKLNVLGENEISSLKRSIESLKAKNIIVNIVGLSEKSKIELREKNLIPILVKENDFFNEFSNCVLNISFQMHEEITT